MKPRMWWLAGVVAGVLAVSSCTSINVTALPQPGNSYRGGYDIVIEFDNALNLPERAKVVMDGTTVGVVTEVALSSRAADVTSRIDPAVAVPSNIRAVLQQDTVLGDIYVALDRPRDQAAGPVLRSGDRVPLAQTSSPPQLEDTIANMANFVSSGSIQRIQNTIIHINRLQPPGGEAAIRKMASQVAADLGDLSDNMNLVDQWLDGVSGTVGVMHRRIMIFQDMFSESGMTAFKRFMEIFSYVGTLLPATGSIYSGGFWLMPLLHSLTETAGAMQQSKWSFEEEWPAWRRVFTDFFLPQDKYPAINITSIVGPDGRELSGNVQEVLRILGATP
ncbi:MlaD family protein [Mycolicibacter kumamotonensis]|uniref:MlaD family protein n=1 Tax=Mycolicibacter kumamotonensis TaxID=354243 RepID=UPI0014794401|nr:MlaD family protein [Mycolicibacter kumamotonensis]